MNKEALDYAESEATKNIEFHLKNIESLSKEAHLTLAVLMVSIPAAFTVAIKLYQKDGMWTWATALLLLSTYLWFLAVYVGKAMKPRGVHAPGHEPNNLLPALREEKHTLEQIRESALINMQERIDWNRKRSEETGGIINQTRRAIIASPFVFLAFVLLILFVRWTLTFGC